MAPSRWCVCEGPPCRIEGAAEWNSGADDFYTAIYTCFPKLGLFGLAREILSVCLIAYFQRRGEVSDVVRSFR